MTGVLPYAVDMVMETGMFSAAISISGDKFTTELESRRNSFDTQFEQTFGLKAKVIGLTTYEMLLYNNYRPIKFTCF